MTPILYVRIPILFGNPLERLILSSSIPIRGIQRLRRTCHSVTHGPSPTIQLSRMMSSHMFDNIGGQYNVSRILTPQSTLDEEAYKQYSPLFLSYVVVTFLLSLGLIGVVPHLPWHTA
jgi:hypothetical protein